MVSIYPKGGLLSIGWGSAYLLRRWSSEIGKKKHIFSRKYPPPPPSHNTGNPSIMSAYHDQLRGVSNFCAIYSITGIMFMLWVWLLTTHQPFFVGGIMHDVDTYRNSAHGAMFAFVATFAASMVFLYYDANRSEVDAQIAEAMLTTQGSSLLSGRRLRTGSHDSGSDDGSYGSDDEADHQGVVRRRQGAFASCIRQRNNCFPDRDLA